MARLRIYEENRDGWLITFADMVTLILALFVLIFSMSSLDSAVVQSISSSVNRDLPKRDSHRGKITEDIRQVAQLLADTGQVHQHEGRIKELLFPRDLLPPGVDKGTLDTSLRVVETGEGVTFVMGNDLLFEGEGSRVSKTGRDILASLMPLCDFLQSEVRISAFYDGPPSAGPTGAQPDSYASAGRYALAALGVFINQGAELGRFSISAYGGDRAGLEAQAGNAPLDRVEILLKTGKKALEEREE